MNSKSLSEGKKGIGRHVSDVLYLIMGEIFKNPWQSGHTKNRIFERQNLKEAAVTSSNLLILMEGIWACRRAVIGHRLLLNQDRHPPDSRSVGPASPTHFPFSIPQPDSDSRSCDTGQVRNQLAKALGQFHRQMERAPECPFSCPGLRWVLTPFGGAADVLCHVGGTKAASLGFEM